MAYPYLVQDLETLRTLENKPYISAMVKAAGNGHYNDNIHPGVLLTSNLKYLLTMLETQAGKDLCNAMIKRAETHA